MEEIQNEINKIMDNKTLTSRYSNEEEKLLFAKKWIWGKATQRGDFEKIKLLHENKIEGYTPGVLNLLIFYKKDLNIVKWFHENGYTLTHSNVCHVMSYIGTEHEYIFDFIYEHAVDFDLDKATLDYIYAISHPSNKALKEVEKLWNKCASGKLPDKYYELYWNLRQEAHEKAIHEHWHSESDSDY